jgi:N-acetylneuraminic acid mutarotase
MKKLVFSAFAVGLCLSATILFSVSGFSQAQWSQLSNFPNGRGGHNLISDDNYGYLCGGNNGFYLDSLIYKYDPSTNIWTIHDTIQTPRENGVSFTINGISYFTLGGNNSMEAYNAATKSWTIMADFPSVDRSGSVVFVIGTDAYVGLGIDQSGNNYSDFYRYNSILNTWTPITSFPTVRSNAVAFEINGNGYVGTGLINWNVPLANDLWEYNPITNIWSQKADIPGIGRYGSFGFSWNGKGYIGGGEKVNPTGLLSDILVYNPNDNSWNSYSNYPGGGVNYAETFKFNNEIYVGGGGYGWRDDFYKISDSTNNLPILDKLDLIQIFPNPSNDHITIDAGDLATMNGYSIKIEDAQGQQVFQNAVNQQQFYVDITTWGGNGLYFVRIIDPQGNTVDIKKIVLQ